MAGVGCSLFIVFWVTLLIIIPMFIAYPAFTMGVIAVIAIAVSLIRNTE